MLSRVVRAAQPLYEVLRAYNAHDGLARLREKGADAIVLDLLMPEIDGLAFLQKLREGGFEGIPVIVVTSRVYDVDDAQQWASRLFVVSYGRGMSNEEALSHLKAVLRAQTGDAT